MTTAYEPGTIPQFDRPDRLKKAVSLSDCSHADMAEYLGITRETLSRYTNGRQQAPTAIVRLIALRSGVPFEWIESGTQPSSDPDPEGVATPDSPNAKKSS